VDRSSIFSIYFRFFFAIISAWEMRELASSRSLIQRIAHPENSCAGILPSKPKDF
jgi:hypothetical protein